MAKKIFKRILISFAVAFVLLLLFYGYVAYKYSKGFSYGTYINGVPCYGKTMAQINTELLNKIGQYEGLRIYDEDRKEYFISAEDVLLKYDFTNKLTLMKNAQSPLLWIKNLINPANINILPDISYNEELFDTVVYDLDFFTHVPEENRVIRINKTLLNGYELINMRENVLNEEYANKLIYDAFANFDTSLDLAQKGCYRNLSTTEEMRNEIELFKKIEKFQDRNIVFIMGEDRESIDRSNAWRFMKKDENGNFLFDENGDIVVDEEELLLFVDELADKYDTYGVPRKFKTTQGRTVYVEGGNYGNKLDREAEKEYLLEAFKSGVNEEHEPTYEYEVPIKGLNDMGDTYIEIDITYQRMYYYEDGELIVDTPIVTGNIPGHATIRGTYFIYNHRQNTVLVGPDYRSFVYYWLGVYKGYGIHDASWRSEFGGQIYKGNGSHGCINTPYANIKIMWERVEDGTPCILFY